MSWVPRMARRYCCCATPLADAALAGPSHHSSLSLRLTSGFLHVAICAHLAHADGVPLRTSSSSCYARFAVHAGANTTSRSGFPLTGADVEARSSGFGGSVVRECQEALLLGYRPRFKCGPACVWLPSIRACGSGDERVPLDANHLARASAHACGLGHIDMNALTRATFLSPPPPIARVTSAPPPGGAPPGRPVKGASCRRVSASDAGLSRACKTGPLLRASGALSAPEWIDATLSLWGANKREGEEEEEREERLTRSGRRFAFRSAW